MKPYKRPKTPLTESQIQAMANAIDINNPLHTRILAIVMLVLITGRKLTEISKLNVGDIDLEKKLIHYKSSHRPAVIPLSTTTIKCLEMYLKVRSAHTTKENDQFFLNRCGKRLSPRTMERDIQKLGKIAGIENFYHSTLRQTFYENYFGQGEPPLQYLKGYINISSTLDFPSFAKLLSPHSQEIA